MKDAASDFRTFLADTPPAFCASSTAASLRAAAAHTGEVGVTETVLHRHARRRGERPAAAGCRLDGPSARATDAPMLPTPITALAADKLNERSPPPASPAWRARGT